MKPFFFLSPVLFLSRRRTLTIHFIISAVIIFLILSGLSFFIVVRNRDQQIRQSFYHYYELTQRMGNLNPDFDPVKPQIQNNLIRPNQPPALMNPNREGYQPFQDQDPPPEQNETHGWIAQPEQIETFFSHEEHYFINKSGEPQGILSDSAGQIVNKIDSFLAKQLLIKAENEDYSLLIIKSAYRNYNGIKVYGAGFWLEDQDLGFIVEKNAYDINKMPKQILILILTVLLSCILLFLYLVLWIDRLRLHSLDANPLTHMPGNKAIREHIQNLIKSKRHAVVIYGDLDNFKAYNDVYGFSKGDDVIHFTSDVIKKCIALDKSESAFCGHIGGDDFVFSVKENLADKVARKIAECFEEEIQQFYNDDDFARGGIYSLNRDGKNVKYPLISFSMAGVNISKNNFNHYLEVTNICSEMKKQAKKQSGSVLVMNKRVYE